MPSQLTEEEVEDIVDDAIAEVGATSLRDQVRRGTLLRRPHVRAQFSKRKPVTLPNSRSLFDTRISFRPSACAAINVSNGPMGVPARSSFARTVA